MVVYKMFYVALVTKILFWFLRDMKTCDIYDAHKKKVKTEWCSLDSYLEHSIFNIPYHVDENGLKFTKYVETVG